MARAWLAAAVLVPAAAPAGAATLAVELRDARGAHVPNAVAWAVPEGSQPLPAPRPAVMDQRSRSFVPHVLVVQTGAAVRFPNHDNVRHQVYSFSAVKKFQLPLYSGTPAQPVVFDRPGVVPLGCNIHDRMSAFVVVVDTPHFASLERGGALLLDLPEGSYSVHVWYEGMRAEPPLQRVSVGAGERRQLRFTAAVR